MRKHALRALSCTLAVLVALVSVLALGACSDSGPSDEEAIREDLSANLDLIKNLDESTMEGLVAEIDASSLEPYGIDGIDVVRSLLDGFDYRIDAVTVDEGGESATASVTITCKSVQDFYEAAAETSGDLVSELLSDVSNLELLSDQDALNLRIGEAMMEALDAIEPRDVTIDVGYSKSGDTWVATDTAALSQIFTSTETPQVDDMADAAEEGSEPSAGTTASGPSGQQNALQSAQDYLDFSHFSYQGLIDQLEYEGYTTEDATWAADNCGADWNEQALGSAREYLEFTAFSYEGLIDQLEFEDFTTEQATYAADSCGADWNEQAAKCAQEYLDYSSFSRDELIGQLEFEGFTSEQAAYGVSAVGL